MKRLARLGALLLLLGTLLLPVHAASAPDGLSDLCNDQAWEVLALTNKQRMANGLLPLSAFPTLQKISNLRTDELLTVYDHVRPDGTSCFTAVAEFGLSYRSVAENIAAGQPTAERVVTSWMNSTGHRENILNVNLVHAAMGHVSQPGSEWTNYWAQFFLSDFGCNITAIRVLPGENGLTIPAGGSVEDLGAAVELTCAAHGACYLPLIEEMCTTDTSTGVVTVRYDTLTCQFELSTEEPPASSEPVQPSDPSEPVQPSDPSEPFQVTDGYFTAEVVDGKATIIAFYDPYMYWGITYIHFPETIQGYPVVGLGDGVFSGLYLGDVTLPSTITEISEGAFRDTEFNSMTFQGNITTIAPSAFEGAGFDTLILPEGVISIDKRAFLNARFNNLNVPASVESIGERAFYNSSLREFPNLPNLKSVDTWAFAYCAVSGVVNLPASLTDIEWYGFSYMDYVTDFVVDPANPTYASQDGVLYVRDSTDPDILRTLYSYPIGNTRAEYIIPDTVISLHCNSFARVKNLETLYITNPSASHMTYTFAGSEIERIVCTGYSPVYAALSKSGSKSAEIVPYILSYKDDDRIVFDMSYTFDVAQFYLAAYDADGRMIDIQYVDNIHTSLSWYHNAVIEVYHADKVAKVKLFQFDDSYTPTGESMTLWGT